MAKRSAPRRDTATPSLARRLEQGLSDTLSALTQSLQKAARGPGKASRSPAGAAQARRPRAASATPNRRRRRPAAPSTTPRAPASVVLATLQVSGVRDARLVEGTIWRPGTAAPVPHAWVEAGDRVHDPTQDEGRRVWPRELYYLVFRAVAAPRRAA